MTWWEDLVAEEPEFAARVRTRFQVGKHCTMATLRADGAPRISGIEVEFAGGQLRFGSMPGARKGADLRRDPRFALHSAPFDPPEGVPADRVGDAKVAGRAVSTGPLAGEVDGEGFRADLTEVVVTGLNEAGTLLRIDSWRPERGFRRVERA
jgi:hypothetical protein